MLQFTIEKTPSDLDGFDRGATCQFQAVPQPQNSLLIVAQHAKIILTILISKLIGFHIKKIDVRVLYCTIVFIVCQKIFNHVTKSIN